MIVRMPARFLGRHVGGNSTYAQSLRGALGDQGVQVVPFGPARGGAAAFVGESLSALTTKRDIVHFVGDTAGFLNPRGPVVVTVHGVASRWISTARDPRQEATWRWRVRRAVEASDAVVTVSHSSARDIAEVFGLPLEAITVIPHGLDHIESDAAAGPATDLPVLPERFALYLGNIEPRKNLVELVAAFDTPELKARGLPLVVAGGPAWNFEESMSAISAAANTIYVGRVSDAARSELMARAELFVFPSLYEGFGFPILEAMSLGCPVVTSRRGSLEEVAGPARALPDVTAEAIAAGVGEALDDTRWLAEIRSTGPEWAAQYTWAKSAARHADVYAEVSER